MRSRTRLLVLLLLVVSTVLAGCSGAMQSGSDGAGDNDLGSSSDTSLTQSAGDAGEQEKSSDNYFQGQSLGQAETSQRSIIMTGEVRLEVDDFETARSQIVKATSERGGYVSGSDATLHRDGNRTWKTGMVELRIPKENFESLMTAAESSGTVVNSKTDSQDVTDQLVDIEARLSNLRSQRDTLRDLYEDANETEDVLEVQERLSEVQTEIEQLEAKQRSLEDRVAYSTVTVRIEEPRPNQPSITQERLSWYENGVLSAFLESAGGVVVVIRALVVGFAYALPYLAVFGIPLGGAALVLKRRRP